MSVDINIDGARAIIKPQENMESPVIEDLRGKLKDLLGKGILEFVFDMATVSVVDSLGIGLLIMCHNSLNKIGGHIELINTAPGVCEEFRMIRLDRHFKISAAG